MSVTCIVKYKESCKKLVVGGEKAAADVRTALLTSPFRDVVDNLLIQVSDMRAHVLCGTCRGARAAFKIRSQRFSISIK